MNKSLQMDRWQWARSWSESLPRLRLVVRFIRCGLTAMEHDCWWLFLPNVVDVVDDDEFVADDDDPEDLSGIIMLMFSTNCVLYGFNVMCAREPGPWCAADMRGCVRRLVEVVEGARVALWPPCCCIICWFVKTYWEWAWKKEKLKFKLKSFLF